MRTITTTSLVAAAATLVGLTTPASAQLDPSLVTGLSSNCASGLVGLVTTSNVSSCLALPTAVGALTSAGNNSVVPGLESYLSSSICGSGKTACTTAQLSAANATLLQSCGSDLQQGASIPTLIAFFLNRYDSIRTAGCLQNSQSKYCLIEEMYTLQNTTQMPISFTTIQSILSNSTTQQQSIQALAANKTAFCTDCTHGLYTALFPSNSNQRLAGAVNQTCGAEYLDGKIPSSLKSTAQGNSTSSGSSSGSGSKGNGALGLLDVKSVVSVGTAALAAVAAGFTLL